MPCARILGLAMLALGLVGGCVRGFSRGEIARASEGRDVGCVEVRARHGHDAFARHPPNEGAEVPLVEVSFGNGCPNAVAIDLARVQVWVYRPGVPSRQLGLVDPRGEVRAMLLDTDTSGVETLAYSDGEPVPAEATLCVAIDAIVEVERGAPVPPICFAAHGGGAR